MKTKRTKLYFALHLLLLVFSLSPVCSKLASQSLVFSGRFFLFYGISLGILGLYAITWQQIIKRMPLTAAYANRAITVVWGLVWGSFIFDEKVTPLKLAAAALIIGGVVLYAVAQGEEGKTSD